jgi:hypothetical protein
VGLSTLTSTRDAAHYVIAKARTILSEPELLRAMFDVGYFPPNTPPEHAYHKFEFRFLNQKFSGAGRPSAYVRL